jgi:hypothetical protein
MAIFRFPFVVRSLQSILRISGNSYIVNGIYQFAICTNNLDFASFEHFENLEKRSSFDRFRPRGRDGDHGVCCPVSFAPYLMQIRWIWTTLNGFLVLQIILKTKSLLSTRKIIHSHLLYTNVAMLKFCTHLCFPITLFAFLHAPLLRYGNFQLARTTA